MKHVPTHVHIHLGKLPTDVADPDHDNDAMANDPDHDEAAMMPPGTSEHVMPVHVVVASIKKHGVKKVSKK